jgi:hypothetical protein
MPIKANYVAPLSSIGAYPNGPLARSEWLRVYRFPAALSAVESRRVRPLFQLLCSATDSERNLAAANGLPSSPPCRSGIMDGDCAKVIDWRSW